MTAKFVDYSATYDGDGTAANQAASAGAAGAFNTLVSKTFSAGDQIWMRRVTSSAQGAMLTLSQTVGCEIIGWPKSTDLYYSVRPASGQSNGWDSDAGDYAAILFNNSSYYLTVSGQNYKLYRLSTQQNATSACALYVNGTTNEFYDCYFYHNHATQGSSNIVVNITGSTNKFVRVEVESPNNSSSAFIVYAATGTACKFFDCIITANSAYSSANVFYLASNDHLVHGLTINITSCTVAMPVVQITGNNCKLSDVAINASGGVTTFMPLTVSGSANYISGFSTNSGGNATNALMLVSGSHNIISVADWTNNPTTNTNGINITGAGNRIILKNGTFSGNTQDINLSTGQNNTILCNNVTFSSSPIIATGYHETSKVLSYNHNKIAGSYKAIFTVGEINGSNTYRTDGESFSFKLESLAAGLGERGQLQLGYPGAETIWLALTAGSRTVTLYGAHKSFSATPPKKHHIWIEFEYLDADGNYTHVSSYDYDTALASDTSEWNGDTDLTAFKIPVAVTVDDDCIVPLRIHYHDYVASAYMYIDPKVGVA